MSPDPDWAGIGDLLPISPRSQTPHSPIPRATPSRRDLARKIPIADWARIGNFSIGILPRFPICRDLGKSGNPDFARESGIGGCEMGLRMCALRQPCLLATLQLENTWLKRPSYSFTLKGADSRMTRVLIKLARCRRRHSLVRGPVSRHYPTEHTDQGFLVSCHDQAPGRHWQLPGAWNHGGTEPFDSTVTPSRCQWRRCDGWIHDPIRCLMGARQHPRCSPYDLLVTIRSDSESVT